MPVDLCLKLTEVFDPDSNACLRFHNFERASDKWLKGVMQIKIQNIDVVIPVHLSGWALNALRENYECKLPLNKSIYFSTDYHYTELTISPYNEEYDYIEICASIPEERNLRSYLSLKSKSLTKTSKKMMDENIKRKPILGKYIGKREYPNYAFYYIPNIKDKLLSFFSKNATNSAPRVKPGIGLELGGLIVKKDDFRDFVYSTFGLIDIFKLNVEYQY